jgi:hypothetical protein
MPKLYHEMAERIVRSYKKIPEPGYPGVTKEEVWDAYLHFFLNAYHLKDWIINDKELKINHKEMNNFIDRNENMKLLQAIVTKSKHLNADRYHIAFKEIHLSWNDGSPKSSPEIEYEDRAFFQTEDGGFLLQENGKRIELESFQKKNIHPRTLVVKVLVAWNKFFKKKKLEGGFIIKQ